MGNVRIKLDPKVVEQTILDARNQSDAALALYRQVIPDFNQVISVGHWPKITQSTSVKIFGVFDKRFGAAGSLLWMNNGFGSLDAPADLPDWTVEVDLSAIEYAKTFEVQHDFH